MNKPKITYIGIDISQEHIDIHHPHHRQLCGEIPNRNRSISLLLKRLLKEKQPCQIIAEATGRCERILLALCHEKGVPITLLNPESAHHFIKATGQRAKSDKIDAFMLSQLGEALQPAPTAPIPAEIQRLNDLNTRRKQLIAMRSGEQCRLTRMPKEIGTCIKTLIRALDRQIALIDKKIDALIKSSRKLSAQLDCLMATKGIGRVSAAQLLASLPELGTLSRNQITALAGLAPYNRDSGMFKGKRTIGGGRALARNALYMPALSASRHNESIRVFYNRLIEKGKPAKVALTACMRKLLIHFNTNMRILIENNSF